MRLMNGFCCTPGAKGQQIQPRVHTEIAPRGRRPVRPPRIRTLPPGGIHGPRAGRVGSNGEPSCAGCGRAQPSLASSVISALSTRDTGQFAFAPAAISANFSGVIPGTLATVRRWIEVIVQLVCGWFSKLSSAEVLRVSAVNPAPSRAAESAIVKQPAWAAAMSSSGFVPEPLANRDVKEYGVCRRTPLSVETAPLPLLRFPCQMADAFRFISREREPAIRQFARWRPSWP